MCLPCANSQLCRVLGRAGLALKVKAEEENAYQHAHCRVTAVVANIAYLLPAAAPAPAWLLCVSHLLAASLSTKQLTSNRQMAKSGWEMRRAMALRPASHARQTICQHARAGLMP